MKSFIKLFFIFFALLILLISQPSSLHAQTIDFNGYIKNIDREEVVLVSNNLLNGEITSCQKEQQENLSGETPLIISFDYNKNIFLKNNTQINGSFIHNLSTDNQKIQPIRAP